MTLTGNNAITLRKFTSRVTAEKGIPLNIFTKSEVLGSVTAFTEVLGSVTAFNTKQVNMVN